MKKSNVILSALLAAVAGCNQSTPGGPGVKTTPSTTVTTNDTKTIVHRPVYGEADQTFRLSLPVLAVQVKQGETKTVTISVDRGKNFDEDVRLNLTGMPAGITTESSDAVIKHGEKEASVKIQAADDAALGDFTIHVTGHPTKGADATSEFKLSVSESQ